MFEILVFFTQLIVLWIVLTFGGALGFFVMQLAVERFILQTLPILVELYGRIRYPNDFKDE